MTNTNHIDHELAETKLSNELRAEDLERVVGGTITKTTDKSSPVLFQNCCNGTHY